LLSPGQRPSSTLAPCDDSDDMEVRCIRHYTLKRSETDQRCVGVCMFLARSCLLASLPWTLHKRSQSQQGKGVHAAWRQRKPQYLIASPLLKAPKVDHKDPQALLTRQTRYIVSTHL
jgi:hypothetical protein